MQGFLVGLVLVASSLVANAGPREEALRVLDRWTKAFAESDVDAIADLYAPDALFFGTGSKTLVTQPGDVRTYFEQALLTNRPRGAFLREHSVIVLSDTAVLVTGLDTVTGVREGKAHSAYGRFTFVVERRGPLWKIVHFHRSAVPV